MGDVAQPDLGTPGWVQLAWDAVAGVARRVACDAAGLIGIQGTVTAQQGGAPWTADVTKVGGAAVVVDGAGVAVVHIDNQGATVLDVAGTVQQGGAPWSTTIVQGGNTAAVVSAVPAESTGTGLLVQPIKGRLATYSAVVSPLACANAPTDVWGIVGVALKVLRIWRVRVAIRGVTGLPGTFVMSLIKRSALDTGGAATYPTAVPHDSGQGAAGGTVVAYTANPAALGAAVGTVEAVEVANPGVGVTAIWTFDYGHASADCRALVLRAATEGLYLNLGGVAFTAASATICVEWTEE